MSAELPVTTETTTPPPRMVAVIDIGATSIRMAIAEIDNAGRVRPIDQLVQPVSLGKDAFTSRRLRRSSIEECVRVLRAYRKVLQQYDITRNDQIRVVATSAVREVVNRLAFLDRVFIATGIEVETIEEAEVNRITYMGVQRHLEQDSQLASAKCVVVEVSGGSTELLVVRGGNVLFSHAYRLGAMRLAETLASLGAPIGKRRGLMENEIRQTVDRILEHVRADMRIELIALGGDVRLAARLLMGDFRGVISIPVASLEKLTDQVLSASEEELVQQYEISFTEAETLGPALLAYVMLAKAFDLKELWVSDTNLRDGLLHDMAMRDAWTAEFRNQIVRSAISLGRKFDFDEPHARHVAMLSRKLFVQLEDEHRLDSRFEVILYVAALLHEVGLYVNVRSHHKHAMYLIRNSELFGLSRQDLLLVALVARYHRRASPLATHEGYATLDRNSRVAVSKLAAILRVAIALDGSRTGRIKEMRCVRQRDYLSIQLPGVSDVSLEELALRQSVGLFEEIFGMTVRLRLVGG